MSAEGTGREARGDDAEPRDRQRQLERRGERELRGPQPVQHGGEGQEGERGVLSGAGGVHERQCHSHPRFLLFERVQVAALGEGECEFYSGHCRLLQRGAERGSGRGEEQCVETDDVRADGE